MNILGIDYGRKKIGLAISYSEAGSRSKAESHGKLAEPYQVIRYKASLPLRGKDFDKMIAHIKRIIEKQKIEKVVVGVSEGEMGEESRKFAENFNAETFDETLSSKDAITMSVQSGMGRKRRKEMEDAFAASVMLQSYLDNV